MAKLQAVRGTHDLLFMDYQTHQYIVEIASKVVAYYGYSGIATPIFEFTEVFKRTLGETSDVVTKEMYSFETKEDGESLTLRPEFTAGVARSIISNGLFQDLPLKLFSHGPVFRHERPQKGRFRQFHQINAESIGVSSPLMDSEIITMAAQILRELGILEQTKLEVNTLGCEQSRMHYRTKLVEYFSKYSHELSEESKIRLQKNPLRILDSKSEQDKQIIATAPKIEQSLTDMAKKFFDDMLEGLTINNIKYHINPYLVRGLDYYCHSAFEFTTDQLGAQGTVLAGGRYDRLIKIMGGQDTPAVGFASGMERLALLMDHKPEQERPIVVIPLDEQFFSQAMIIANILRENKFVVLMDYQGNFNKKIKRANKLNARIVIFIGAEEIDQQTLRIKDFDTGVEQQVNNNHLLDYISKFK